MPENEGQGILAYELDARDEADPDFSIVTFENGSQLDEVLTKAMIQLSSSRSAVSTMQPHMSPGKKRGQPLTAALLVTKDTS